MEPLPSGLAREYQRLTGAALSRHVFTHTALVGMDHQGGVNWKSTLYADGQRTIVWKSSPIRHGRAQGVAEIVNNKVCITYPQVKNYRDVCSEIYHTGVIDLKCGVMASTGRRTMSRITKGNVTSIDGNAGNSRQ